MQRRVRKGSHCRRRRRLYGQSATPGEPVASKEDSPLVDRDHLTTAVADGLERQHPLDLVAAQRVGDRLGDGLALGIRLAQRLTPLAMAPGAGQGGAVLGLHADQARRAEDAPREDEVSEAARQAV